MTVFEFNPRFENKNNWSCASVDKNSPWCLAISDCIWHYEGRFYKIDTQVRYCNWPLDRKSFEVARPKEKLGCKTYEEYLKRDPRVEYLSSYDNCFYGLVNTDNTCDFAYQNEKFVFIIHITSEYRETYYEGFGCILNKMTNEINCVALGEDDGNYWGDHDIDYSELKDYEWGIISSIINDMNNNLFWNKELLIEKIFNLANETKR